jgi:LacI family transcriptional regulator
MSTSKTTLKDIADKVGCSKNTVSLALRNSPRISEAVSKKIHRLARKLHYTPNSRVNEAMSYVRSHKKAVLQETLGILVDWPVSSKEELAYHQHLHLIFKSIEQRAQELGYGTDYLFISAPGMTEKRMERIIRSRGIRGLIVVPVSKGPARLRMNLEQFASIQIGRTVWSPRMDTVAADDGDCVYLAAKVLWRRGYRRIGFFFSRWALAQSLNRLEMGALYSQKHIPDIEKIPIGITERQRTQQDVLDSDKLKKDFIPWFKKHRPEAVICLGVPVKEILEKNLKLRVPDEVAIVQYDYVPKPGVEFAGISHQKDLQAAYAVERLTTKISHSLFGLPPAPLEVSFPVKWVDGPSIKREMP